MVEIGDRDDGQFGCDSICSQECFETWCTWADANVRLLDVRDRFAHHKTGPHNVHCVEALFASMWTSYKVRTDKALAEVSLSAFSYLCPRPLKPWLRENWHDLKASIPSPATVSRCRLAFDCSWMLYWQQYIEESIAEDHVFFTLMVDASPMFGKDWSNMQYDVIDARRIGTVFDISEAMVETHPDEFDRCFGDDMQEWQSSIHSHIGVPFRSKLPRRVCRKRERERASV